jgi:hypothetical protein
MTALADIRAGWTLPADLVALKFSVHACDRYAQRIRPALDQPRVRVELSALLASARVTRERPAWLTNEEGPRASAYLVLTDDIVAPLHQHGSELIASTLLLICAASGYVLSMMGATRFPCSTGFRVTRRRT